MGGSQVTFVLVGGALVLGILALGVLLWWRHVKTRREAWEAMAQQLGMSFEPLNEGFIYDHAEFKLFTAGYGQLAKNILTGKVQDLDVVLADYQYTIGGGRRSHTCRHTICIVKSPELRLPGFNVRREIPLYDDLGSALGGQDIDFVEDPDFSRAFVLQGYDEAAVRQLFGLGVRRELLQHWNSDLVLEGLGDQIVVHFGVRLDPSQARGLLDLSVHLSNLFASA